MKTITELKVFKNGGSRAVRLPAGFLENQVLLFAEYDEASDSITITKRHPKPFDSLFALHEKYGPITDDEWVLERDNQPEPIRQSIQELIDAK